MSKPEQQKRAFAAKKAGHVLEAHTFVPKPLGPNAIAVNVSHCGMCHSDLHKIGNEWVESGGGSTSYPCVPGHEVVGVVTEVGSEVKDFKIGQRVGFGPQRGSCLECEWCLKGEENLCENFESLYDPETGGYAEHIRVNTRFAFPIPDAIDSAHAAPLLCAGVTVFSPLVHFAPKQGGAVGVVGIGGLGHLALQFAAGMGFKVVAISTSPQKFDEAKQFGAQAFINSKSVDDMKKNANTLDLILFTASNQVDWDEYLKLLRPTGKLCLLGAPEGKVAFKPFSVVMGRRSICGSPIGGVKDMNDMFTFAAKYNIRPKIEVVKLKWSEVDKVNAAVNKVEKNTARYRMVLEYDNQ